MPDLSLNPDIGTQRAPRVSPYPDASLYLDFLTMSANFMDSRITFSRGTNATLTDSTGRITYAPANLLLRSGDLGNGTFWTDGPIVNGTRTAGSVSVTTDEGYAYIQSGGLGALVGQHIFSADVVCNQTIANVPIRFTAGGPAGFVLVNMVAGVSQRIFIAVNAAATAGTAVAFGLDARNAIVPGGSNATGYVVTFNNVQLEPVTYQTTPSTYVATTSAAYYGPRFDCDPVTLAPRGLLIEEQRTNLLVRSEEFDNASWNKTRSSVSANATASPSGVVNADKLVENTDASTTHGINQVFTGTAASHTFTVYAKAGERSQIRMRLYDGTTFVNETYFNLATGAVGAGTGGTITNAGNGWYRCSVTGTLAASAGCQAQIFLAVGGSDSYTGDGTSGLFLWGAQLEAGSFATSYIPTVASTVTRNADVATMTGTNFSDWYNQSAGTFVVDADSYTITTTDFVLTASDGTTNNRFGIYRSSPNIGGYVVTGNVTQMDLTRTPVAANTPYRAAVAATLNDGNMALNGSLAAGDTSITMATLDRLSIGANNGAGFISGHIRQIAYFNTRQPNTQLQTLTAPALVPSLSLDFINNVYNVGF